MKLLVETPKWSFVKSVKTHKGFRTAFISPVPTPFNYGYIEGTAGEDSQPLDVIILGKRLERGTVIDTEVIGKVSFIDAGIQDDKYIATLDGGRHEASIRLFFIIYSIAKKVLGLLGQGHIVETTFKGVTWFEQPIDDMNKL